MNKCVKSVSCTFVIHRYSRSSNTPRSIPCSVVEAAILSPPWSTSARPRLQFLCALLSRLLYFSFHAVFVLISPFCLYSAFSVPASVLYPSLTRSSSRLCPDSVPAAFLIRSASSHFHSIRVRFSSRFCCIPVPVPSRPLAVNYFVRYWLCRHQRSIDYVLSVMWINDV